MVEPPHFVGEEHCACSFAHWRMLELFASFGIGIGSQRTFVQMKMHLYSEASRFRMAGPCSKSLFIFIDNQRSVFQRSCSVLYQQTLSPWFLHILTATRDCQAVDTLLGAWCHLTWPILFPCHQCYHLPACLFHFLISFSFQMITLDLCM